jgi:hypothetical protein
MAKKKLTFDAIFEGNDIKEDAKKKISAMLEDVVARKMGEEEEEEEEKKKEESEEEDPEKMAAAAHADDAGAEEEKEEEDPEEEGHEKKEVEEEEEEEEEEYTQNPDNKENDVLTNEEEEEDDEEEEKEKEMKEDAAVELKNDLPALLRDSDIVRVFKALNLNMGEVLRSAKAMTLDLAKNPQAEPMVAAFHKLLRTIKDDSSVSSRIAGDLKKAEAGKEEEEESYSEEFVDRLNQYLAYVAEQWSESNKIAIENGIKVQLAESFLSNIKGMYEQYNFTNIPTRDMVVELGNKVTVAENKLNEQIEKNAKLLEKYNKQRKEILVSEASKGLTVTQVEKFKKLTEDVSFEDEKSFKSKIAVIKENAFTKTAVKSDTKLETETGPDDQLLNERMSKYVDVISKNLKF